MTPQSPGFLLMSLDPQFFLQVRYDQDSGWETPSFCRIHAISGTFDQMFSVFAFWCGNKPFDSWRLVSERGVVVLSREVNFKFARSSSAGHAAYPALSSGELTIAGGV